jgi:hypothetical protein
MPDRDMRPPAEPPPVNTGAEGVHAEPKRTGHRLLDLSIAVSAILISLTSLAIAIHHGRVQQKLVAANSWPFLTSITSNDFGEPQIWEKFGGSRLKLSFDACYCSILGECWASDLQTLNPKSVQQCEASPDDYIEVGAGFDDSPVLPVIEGS